MKTKVRVTLVAECEVEIESEHEEDEDPTDLTRVEESRAVALADNLPRWQVDRVREIKG